MTKLTLACGLALSLSLLACASTPKPTAASAAPAAGTATATAQAAPTKPKLICEEEKPLGSLLPQRICMTPEEAAQRQRAAQEAVRNMQGNQAPTVHEGSSSGG